MRTEEKKAVQKRTVFKKKVSEFFIDGKDTMMMRTFNEFKRHGTTKRRVTTVNHLIDAFHDNITRMKSILNYFIVISKNFLQNIHEIIMILSNQKENPKSPHE